MKKILFAFILVNINIVVFSQTYVDLSDFDSYDSHSTLAIKSYLHEFTDCGEWGGHKESLFIYKYDSVWTYTYIIYPSECYKPNRLNEKIKKEDTLEIDDLNYIKHFLKIINLTPHTDWISNAPDSYEIRLTLRKKTFYYKLEDADKEIQHEYRALIDKMIKN